MKLLIISNNPSRASFRLRIGEHLEALGREGIESEVCPLPPGALARQRLFKSSRAYDAVLLHRKCLNFRDAMVLWHYRPKLIFDFDDAIMYSPSRPQSECTSHYRLFRRTARMMDVMIAGNAYLAEHAGRYCRQVVVLPTGLDVAAYRVQDRPKRSDTIRLVWIGSQSTLQYLAQLKPVLESVGKKRKNVVLRIIADAFFDLNEMPVERCRWSLMTQAADLAACDIGLSPLPDNRFTRGKCGFKLLQYFAAGLPVVASPVGVNADFINDSGAGLSASTPDEWTAALERMIDNIDTYRQWGQNGRQYVQAFDKNVIARQLCRIIKAAVENQSETIK